MEHKNTIYRRTNKQAAQKAADYGFNKAFIIIMAIIFFGISVFMFAVERPTFSEIEKRPLSEMPEFSWKAYFSGEYTDAVSRYFNDTVPYRDSFKNLRNNIMLLSGIRYKDTTIYLPTPTGTEEPEPSVEIPLTQNPLPSIIIPSPLPSDAVPSETPSKAPSTTPSATPPLATTSPSKTDNPVENDVHFHNGIIIVKDRAMEFYGGKYAAGETYARNISQFKADFPLLNVYSMVVPLSSAYYLPSEYNSKTQNQAKMIAHINSKLTNVMPVDAYNTLLSHSAENIYFRTDHHWTGLGAFYATQAFANAAQVPFMDMSQYEAVTVNGFVGSMYSFTKDAVLLNNPEAFTYYKPLSTYNVEYFDGSLNKVNRNNSLFSQTNSIHGMYSTYLGTDRHIVHIKDTGVNNGRRLVVVKDSYGNPIPTYLTGSFDEIWVLDIRYCNINLSQFITNNSITDLLFTTSIFTASSTSTANHIATLRTQ